MNDLEPTQEASDAETASKSMVEPDPIELGPDQDLVRWTLSLSLEARLAVLQDFVDTFWTPQHG